MSPRAPERSVVERAAGRRATWRDADLAQKGGPRPSSVRAVVRHVARSLVLVRAVESLLIAGAFASGTVAVAVWSGLEQVTPAAVAVALGTGACGGLAWFLELRTSPQRVARRLDRRLRHGGALLTAYELEGDVEPGTLGHLCVERVLDKLRTREALQVLRPSLAPPVVLPLLGATLLALTLESRRDATPPRFLPLDGLASDLEGLGAEAFQSRDAGTLDDADLREVLTLRGEVEQVRLSLEALPPEQALEDLADLDERLADLLPDLIEDPALQAELEQLRSRLDAVQDGLADELAAGAAGGPSPPEAEAIDVPGEGVAQTPGDPDASAGGGAGRGESAPSALADGTPDGTIPGSTPSETGPDGTAGEGVASPLGAADVPEGPRAADPAEASAETPIWWAPSDDPLVSEWLEVLRVRAAASRRSQR